MSEHRFRLGLDQVKAFGMCLVEGWVWYGSQKPLYGGETNVRQVLKAWETYPSQTNQNST